jgi:hypothetical protein
MIIYRVFLKNYGLKKGDLLGVLTERRRDLRGSTPTESGLRWAKSVYSGMVKNKSDLFVVTKEVEESTEPS